MYEVAFSKHRPMPVMSFATPRPRFPRLNCHYDRKSKQIQGNPQTVGIRRAWIAAEFAIEKGRIIHPCRIGIRNVAYVQEPTHRTMSRCFSRCRCANYLFELKRFPPNFSSVTQARSASEGWTAAHPHWRVGLVSTHCREYAVWCEMRVTGPCPHSRFHPHEKFCTK